MSFTNQISVINLKQKHLPIKIIFHVHLIIFYVIIYSTCHYFICGHLPRCTPRAMFDWINFLYWQEAHTLREQVSLTEKHL